MNRRFGFVLVVWATAGCAPDRPMRTPMDALLEEALCVNETRRALRVLGAGEAFIPAPPGPDGAPSVRIPTANLGEWVALTVPVDAPPVVGFLSPDSMTETRFSGDCTPMKGVAEGRSGIDSHVSFTDAYLRELIQHAAPAPLVVYIWSPHMPLAPDGWPEIESAAARAGMRVAPALIAHGDREFALREARRVGLPAEGLREITSIELIARQALVHAPSIVIFGQDRVSPVLPGYRNGEAYLRYLEVFLEEQGPS